MHMATKLKTVTSSFSAATAETQMGGASPQEAPMSGKDYSNGFRHYYEHENALSS